VAEKFFEEHTEMGQKYSSDPPEAFTNQIVAL
jgi:hypothetical protein